MFKDKQFFKELFRLKHFPSESLNIVSIRRNPNPLWPHYRCQYGAVSISDTLVAALFL